MRTMENPKTRTPDPEPFPREVYDGLTHCHAVTGIPRKLILAWKHNGLPGFRGGRIHLHEVRRHFKEVVGEPARLEDF